MKYLFSALAFPPLWLLGTFLLWLRDRRQARTLQDRVGDYYIAMEKNHEVLAKAYEAQRRSKDALK